MPSRSVTATNSTGASVPSPQPLLPRPAPGERERTYGRSILQVLASSVSRAATVARVLKP